ncbi:rhodanese-like domain-containing protein [Shewanella avicenniae]|uniref:Rhodanese-like domain-containing protein n=1 Tax=Shewanella avicenniae TaxID=2814294 RepID=A0ABX7QNN9_9GAMM|nr:rhodanese-like domain-containing protein [Shewanella avicenniae]QSX32333.1 rhodanese-like domain-containing protein [Shewanella avicenniae]
MSWSKTRTTLSAVSLVALLSWQLPAHATSDITPPTAVKLVAQGALLIDVRSAGEFSEGHLDGAKNIEYQQIVDQLAVLEVDKTTPIVLYCRSGRRASVAQQALQQAGYQAVSNAGGFSELQQPFANH